MSQAYSSDGSAQEGRAPYLELLHASSSSFISSSSILLSPHCSDLSLNEFFSFLFIFFPHALYSLDYLT